MIIKENIYNLNDFFQTIEFNPLQMNTFVTFIKMKTVLKFLGAIIFITTCIVIVEADIDMWIIGGVTIILVIVISGFKAIKKKIKLNNKMNAVQRPEHLKELVTKIYKEGADSLASGEKEKAKVWLDEMIVKIDARELKSLRDLDNFIDSKRSKG